MLLWALVFALAIIPSPRFVERSSARLHALGNGLSADDLDTLANVSDVNAAANRSVAMFLRERVAPADPVFVWGFEPVIYDLADRDPASRFIYNVPQRVAWVKDRARVTLMRDLQARPPSAIVVEHGDVFPSVTGNTLDSAAALETFHELARLLRDDFVLDRTIEDFDIYLRRRLTMTTD